MKTPAITFAPAPAKPVMVTHVLTQQGIQPLAKPVKVRQVKPPTFKPGALSVTLD